MPFRMNSVLSVSMSNVYAANRFFLFFFFWFVAVFWTLTVQVPPNWNSDFNTRLLKLWQYRNIFSLVVVPVPFNAWPNLCVLCSTCIWLQLLYESLSCSSISSSPFLGWDHTGTKSIKQEERRELQCICPCNFTYWLILLWQRVANRYLIKDWVPNRSSLSLV